MSPRLVSVLTQGHVDVWRHVLDYFSFDLEEEDTGEMHEAQEVLLSVALVSHSLSSIALDALWKGMVTLQPIVDVINSFASHPEDKIIDYVKIGTEGEQHQWMVLGLSKRPALHSRARQYLARIRYFNSVKPSAKESTLWQFLKSFLACGDLLLPNLQRLEMDWRDAFPSVAQLTLFISPFLKRFHISSDSSEAKADPVLQLIESRGCELTNFSYCAQFTPDLFSRIGSFRGLHGLWLYQPIGDVRRESPISAPELLDHLPSLQRLMVPLGAFPAHTNQSYHDMLQYLHISGNPEELQLFLSNGIKSFGLESLVVSFEGSYLNYSWKRLCEAVMESLPNITSLNIEIISNIGPRLCFPDLSVVLSKPLEFFSLCGVSHNLTPSNLNMMAKAWPNLTTLVITRDLHAAFDASALILLADHPRLDYLVLRLNLQSLLTLLPTSNRPSCSNLRFLSMYYPEAYPSHLRQMIILAQNLVDLFPRVVGVDVLLGLPDDTRGNLQELVRALKSATAIGQRLAQSELERSRGMM
ncbi:hypothetical protein P691DRAFT_151643 [Macrolepiota fuliginosa MF-IS2]|uniref:Uncharacterized protein n=1 Tax=Macrolepiota fuliginosa MF-IS2 TaxID=1400762 RepID=A0A9P5X984_9AGAR|nr:hypothetical protein P691DRAFT_151643 [Macrolepiota fuliginosa MF-IS2]